VPLLAVLISIFLKYLGYVGIAKGFEVFSPILANWVPPVIMILMGKFPPPPEGFSPWSMIVSPPFFWDYYLMYLIQQGAPVLDQIAAAVAIFVFFGSLVISMTFLVVERAGPKCKAYKELVAKIKASTSETLQEYIDAIASIPRCPSLLKVPVYAWLITFIMGGWLIGLHTFLWIYMPWMLVVIWGGFFLAIIFYVIRWYR